MPIIGLERTRDRDVAKFAKVSTGRVVGDAQEMPIIGLERTRDRDVAKFEFVVPIFFGSAGQVWRARLALIAAAR